MSFYDLAYKKNNNYCGAKPNKLLLKIYKKLPKGSTFLDLGCGQGRDTFFMANRKFPVTTIDSSRVAISQIKRFAKNRKINNITPIQKSISNFLISPKKFGFINCINSLQFLPKKYSLKTIREIKKNILPDGFVTIASFTSENPTSRRRKSHFELGELKNLFPLSDFKILHYFEGKIKDAGHIGQPKPHMHGIVEIIAQKKKTA